MLNALHHRFLLACLIIAVFAGLVGVWIHRVQATPFPMPNFQEGPPHARP